MEILSSTPINPNDVYRLINTSTAGSVVIHFAVVRGATDDKTTSSIEFSVAKSKEETIGEMHMISDEIRKKWKVEDVLIIRAAAKLVVGDVMSLVAVSSARSIPAFEASHYGVDRLKEMKTIIKKEVFN